MAEKKVKFTINIGGNAMSGVGKLTDRVNALDTATCKVYSAMQRLGSFGVGFTGFVQMVQTISSKFKAFTDASLAQVEAETKLGQAMRNTMGATGGQIQSILDLASAQQKLGVIGDEVQLAGAQELATYLSRKESLEKLLPVMNDMLAQQYGLNASQEQAAQIAAMLGKVMDGQVGALSRYGYRFDKEQEKILKFGTEEERAATLAKVVGDAVGGMNRRLALTNNGKMKQLSNAFGDLKENVGKLADRASSKLVPAASRLLDVALKLTEVPLPKQIAKEKAELNALVNSLIDAKDKEDERKRIIDEIQGKYPDFIKNIDLEKSTTEELKKALEEVNLEYDKRMKKAALERRMDAYEKEMGEDMDDIVKYEMSINAKSERRRIRKEIDSRLQTLGKDGEQYYFSESDKKVYRKVGQAMGLPSKLDDKTAAEVQTLIDEWDAQGEFETLVKGKKQLEKARKAYDKHQRAKNALQGIINKEFGDDNSDDKPGNKPEEKEDPAGRKASAGAEAVVSGGTRSTTVNISLGNMVESIVFNGSFKENAQELERNVTEIMYRVLAMAATI